MTISVTMEGRTVSLKRGDVEAVRETYPTSAQAEAAMARAAIAARRYVAEGAASRALILIEYTADNAGLGLKGSAGDDAHQAHEQADKHR